MAMGYYYTAEPENAVPPKFWATPKTHVPGSPVKERGLRYFMPETGRWVNRDPAAVGGCSEQSCPSTSLFIAESIFTRNEPIGHVDILGLACAKCPSALTSRIRSGGECGHEYRTKISKGPPSAPNGCGAQGGIFIPDSFFGVVSFTDCCNGHDNRKIGDRLLGGEGTGK